MTDQTKQPRYRWWAVKCPTEKCETTLFLHPIAPETEANRERKYAIPNCSDFTIACLSCDQEHKYEQKDIYEITYHAPSEEHPANLNFQKALSLPTVAGKQEQ
jgi:hypothetical protein